LLQKSGGLSPTALFTLYFLKTKRHIVASEIGADAAFFRALYLVRLVNQPGYELGHTAS
jgi:hypothetical protein